ncbi:Tim44/TimA family putative adaptor protein [Candidatus Odyssella acanthamoebae]|uniref:Tim44/TimA family putative adaptor protein n=1 Tax=Candidatus Odyssella acanthamoebae TaxID=91604 RepID=UPI0018DB6981|nr:Tim44/TimA family putative adaptor protein [Candidatus Paracaedibacter acanthamoebae]
MELIFFALLSAYIFYRLWSVLGQENEADKERREQKKRQFEAMIEDNVIPLPNRHSKERVSEIEEKDLKSGVREALRILRERDPSFNFSHFLKGAKGAYEMVSEAFAKGELETLKLLLLPKVYDAFAKEVEERQRRGESYEVKIERFDRVDVDAIEIHGEDILITVRFRTRQVMVTKNSAGEIIENQAQISIPVTEIWTFTRMIGSNEPNWYLSRTQNA